MNKYLHQSSPFGMDDAHMKSWNDALNISIDDMDDLQNLEHELNQRDDSFSLDEHHLQTIVSDRKTPTSTRKNLLSVSPLKFFGVSPLQMQAVNAPTSYDNNLRKPITSFQHKTESFASKPQTEEPSIRFNDDSAFRKTSKPIPTEPLNNVVHTNGFHSSPKNSLPNGFHSPRNSPMNGFHSPITHTTRSTPQENDFCSRYLSETPNEVPFEEEEEEFRIEEEYIPQSTSPPAKMLHISDLEEKKEILDSYFDTEHVKRKLFDDSTANGYGEANIQNQLKDLFDDEDTFSDIVEITSPLLNLSKSFASLEVTPSPYKNSNYSRESYHSQNTNGTPYSRDSSFSIDSDFNSSFSNGFPKASPFQPKPTANHFTTSTSSTYQSKPTTSSLTTSSTYQPQANNFSSSTTNNYTTSSSSIQTKPTSNFSSSNSPAQPKPTTSNFTTSSYQPQANNFSSSTSSNNYTSSSFQTKPTSNFTASNSTYQPKPSTSFTPSSSSTYQPKPTTNNYTNSSSSTFQTKPTTNNTFQSSYQYQSTFNNTSKPKPPSEETFKPQREPSREFDLMREKQILQDHQQRLENILKSLNQRK